MANTYNPFAPVERSKVETPWGLFEIAPPNKARLAKIEELQAAAESLDDSAAQDSILLGIRIAAVGVKNGDELETKLIAAWNAGDITVDQISGLAEFVGAEITGGAAEGNG